MMQNSNDHDMAEKPSAVRRTPASTTMNTDEVYDDPDDEDEDATGPNKDQKKMKRILANRGSARASYQRRKKMMVELQAMVKDLNHQNSLLEAENKEIRVEIQTIRHQMRMLLLSSTSSSSSNLSTTTSSISMPPMLSLLDSLKMKYATAGSSQPTTMTTVPSLSQPQQQQQHHLSMSQPSTPYNQDLLLAQLLASDHHQSASMSQRDLQSLWNEHLLVRSLAGLPQRGLGL
jgi:hypothetical protein